MKLDQMTKLEGGRYQDADGCILPWYTSPCLEWLMTLDLKGKFVFEYGVGDSTEWFRSRSALLAGVDSNIEYAKKHKSLYAWDKNTYLTSLVYLSTLLGVQYDITIVDGNYRDECVECALCHLKPGGFLILDNYKQPSVEEHWPLTEKLIEGMPITIYKEPEHYDWVTAVVQKP